MSSVIIRTRQQESSTFRGRNRRANNRYAVSRELAYRPSDGASERAWQRGRTLDMSASGILIDIPAGIPVGSQLELEMDWPGLYHDRLMMRLSLTASVVRVDARGTALRILRHEFRDGGRGVVRAKRTETNRAVA